MTDKLAGIVNSIQKQLLNPNAEWIFLKRDQALNVSEFIKKTPRKEEILTKIDKVVFMHGGVLCVNLADVVKILYEDN
jgi:hypothetical protein